MCAERWGREGVDAGRQTYKGDASTAGDWGDQLTYSAEVDGKRPTQAVRVSGHVGDSAEVREPHQKALERGGTLHGDGPDSWKWCVG